MHPDFVPLMTVAEATTSPISGERTISPVYFEQLFKDCIIKLPGTRGKRGRKLVVLPLLAERLTEYITDQLGEQAARRARVPISYAPSYIAMTQEEVDRLRGEQDES